ncbi:MAG: DUF2723 domain-containing protein [Gemmatimonas sp.]|jgi:hypothetical protein|uniref:glycosyltransferase family 117 protein n=2 Tax=Gemmatimonas sp. TaxID=1962908 RepID=UPI00391F8292|nr:DUF2723 domain-containing protein [Gemmatimonadota bacterium]
MTVAATAPATSARLSSATRAEAADLDYRPSYLAAAVAGLVTLLLYLVTLAPTTSMWDTSEYIAAAYVLGIPHPPGNPFFVLIGRVFAILPIAPTVAMRINVLAALSSAASAMFWFLVTERVLVQWMPRRWQRIVGGSLAVLIGATAFTVWNQSVVNEKVYTVSLVGLAVICWLTVRWCDDPEGPLADRLLVLVAYLLGLGYTNHMAGMLAAPAVGVAVLIRRPQTLLRWKLLVACAAALVFGLTPFATQPIRAAHFPAINEGEPTGCVTELKMNCTFSQLTYDRFMYNFNRGQYGKPELSERQAPFSAQLGMYWLYFKWQWLRDAYTENPGLQNGLAVFYFILVILGGWMHFQKDRRSFWFFGPLVFTMTLGLIFYLNFKYGHSQAPELGDSVPREVRDRDYFYLWSFSALSVWAALGLFYLWETVATLFGADEVKLGRDTVVEPRTRSFAMASPLLAVAFIPLFGNWTQASRAGQTDTTDFARDLLNSVEPYGILITVGDNDTFPLWYAQEVEGIRQDVIVANTSLLNTDWYVRQLLRNPVRAYDADKGPAIYKGGTWTKPSGPPVQMTFEEADAMPLAIQTPENAAFQQGELIAQPRLPQLMKSDQLVYFMIRDAFPGRPIYFSRTAGGYPYELGLERYVVTQGMAKRLMPTPQVPGGDLVLIQGEGLVDTKRSYELWNSVFTATKSLAARDGWVDDASVGIPDLYVISGVTLAEALAQSGRMAISDSVYQQSRSIAKAMRRDRIFGFDRMPQLPVEPGADTAAQQLLVPPSNK